MDRSKLIKGYVIGQGRFCPECKGNQLDTGFPEIRPTHISMPMKCQDCSSSWEDIYTLTGVRNVRGRKEEEEQGVLGW